LWTTRSEIVGVVGTLKPSGADELRGVLPAEGTPPGTPNILSDPIGVVSTPHDAIEPIATANRVVALVCFSIDAVLDLINFVIMKS
jgi:hypothetical protein